MALANKVVWSEGLLLRQELFQQQESFFEKHVIQQVDMLSNYQWGVSTLEIADDSLSSHKIGLNKCRGKFKDGTVFDIVSPGTLPSYLEIPSETYNALVYLAIPLQSKYGHINLSETVEQKHLYRYQLKTQEVYDNTNNTSTTVNIDTATLNTCLLLEGQDQSQYSCIAIAKIKECSDERGIILDEQFIAPWLSINKSDQLTSILKEILSLIEHQLHTIKKHYNDAVIFDYSEMKNFLLLQTLSRYKPLYLHILSLPVMHPETLYQHLIQLIGELNIHSEFGKEASSTPKYHHADLAFTFNLLLSQVKQQLSHVFEHHVRALELIKNYYGIYIAASKDNLLFKNSEFIFAVKANIPAQELKRNIVSQINISGADDIEALISSQTEGVDLEALSVVPHKIPFYDEYHYFSLNKASQHWESVIKCNALAINISGDAPGLSLKLWAIKEE